MSRAIIIMLDSLGMGGAPDAASFNDVGANTLGALARYAKEVNQPFNIPHLLSLGLGKAAELSVGHALEGMPQTKDLIGSFGACTEISKGKDTPSGHWEMAGVPVLFDWGYFTKPVNSFPKPLIDKILTRAGLKGSLGNCHASGTDILIALGDEHLKTGLPIFYTSSDSVFQIACHETAFGLDQLYKLCLIAREELMAYNIGRVIARPFIGNQPDNFARTGNRKDYSVKPPAKTVLQKLIEEKQGMVYAIGKIADIYAHSGISYEIKATGFDELYKATFEAMQSAPSNSIIFTNFVDFDSSFGHRRDIKGYKEALERFDARLPELFDRMLPDDVLYITADHGCDPSWIGTDHTRERVPILIYGKNLTSRTLGIRETFADIGQTIAEQFALSPMDHGTALFADLPKNPPS